MVVAVGRAALRLVEFASNRSTGAGHAGGHDDEAGCLTGLGALVVIALNASLTADVADERHGWARRYIETFGLALVPIEPGEKGPKGKAWNTPGGYITDADAAEAFWLEHPDHNLGVVLGPSRVCSLDVDDVEFCRIALREAFGLDLDSLADAFPTTVGNPARFRVMFRVPDGVELSRRSLAWPNQADPDGSILKALTAQMVAAKEAGDATREAALKMAAEPFKKITVFELRGGAVQDVLQRRPRRNDYRRQAVFASQLRSAGQWSQE